VQKGASASASFSLKKFRLKGKREKGRGTEDAEIGKAAPSKLDFRRGTPVTLFPGGRRRRESVIGGFRRHPDDTQPYK